MAGEIHSKREVGLFSAICSIEDADSVIDYTTFGFYFISFIQLVRGIFQSSYYIPEAILIAFLAFLINKIKSRISSIILLLLTAISLVGSFFVSGSISNILLGVLLTFLSFRALSATLKYHKFRRADI